jgi:hypothetical protein
MKYAWASRIGQSAAMLDLQQGLALPSTMQAQAFRDTRIFLADNPVGEGQTFGVFASDDYRVAWCQCAERRHDDKVIGSQ